MKKQRKGVKKRRHRRKPKIGKHILNSDKSMTVDIIARVPFAVFGGGAGGTSDFGMSFPINFPTYYVSTAGTYAGTQLPDIYTKCVAMFDTYYVKNLNITFYPIDTQVQVSTATNNANNYPLLLYGIKDPDDPALLPTELAAISGGVKPHQISDGKVRSFGMRNPLKKVWFNTGLTTDLPSTALAGVIKQNVPQPNAYSSLKLLMPQVLFPAAGVTYYYGNIVVKWVVEFKSIKAV